MHSSTVERYRFVSIVLPLGLSDLVLSEPSDPTARNTEMLRHLSGVLSRTAPGVRHKVVTHGLNLGGHDVSNLIIAEGCRPWAMMCRTACSAADTAHVPATMKAATMSAPQSPLSVQTIRTPKPGSGEVLLKIAACGVCHSDLHVIKGHSTLPTPIVLGHEVSGHVVQYGPHVDDATRARLPLGSPVVATFIMPCGQCYTCNTGKEEICNKFFQHSRTKGVLYDGTTRMYTLDGSPLAMFSMGGLAEYAAVPVGGVHPVPASIPLVDAAIVGCAVFTAYGACKHSAKLQAGENVAVFGAAGGVGSQVVQIARAFGADRIIAVDVDDARLNRTLSLGATHVINARSSDVVARVREITNGRGVDVAMEVLGKPETFRQAIDCVTDGGRVVLIGLAPPGTSGEIEITRLVRREIQVIGSYGGKSRRDVPEIVRMIERGAIDIANSISTRYPSLEHANEAYDALAKGQIAGRAVIKVCPS